MTKQREIILETLAKRIDHPGADDLYSAVRLRSPKISLGTVYRNLEVLAEAGTINRLYFFGQKRFDANIAPHHHFYCTTCGKIEDIPLDIEIPSLDPNDNWVKQREITGATLVYFGLCSECSCS